MLLTSTTAAIFIWISWTVCISSVIFQKWKDIALQMALIDAVANHWFWFKLNIAGLSPYERSRIISIRTQNTNIDLPYVDPTYSGIADIVAHCGFLFLVLIIFAVVEAFGFGDNFVEKHIVHMRLLLISLSISFLMPILATALEHPPDSYGFVEFVLMASACLMSVIVVRWISTLVAIIICVLWMILIFIVVMARFL